MSNDSARIKLLLKFIDKPLSVQESPHGSTTNWLLNMNLLSYDEEKQEISITAEGIECLRERKLIYASNP